MTMARADHGAIRAKTREIDAAGSAATMALFADRLPADRAQREIGVASATHMAGASKSLNGFGNTPPQHPIFKRFSAHHYCFNRNFMMDNRPEPRLFTKANLGEKNLALRWRPWLQSASAKRSPPRPSMARGMERQRRRAMSASIEAADYADPGANMRTQPMGAIP
jgi:hypothetical protein